MDHPYLVDHRGNVVEVLTQRFRRGRLETWGLGHENGTWTLTEYEVRDMGIKFVPICRWEISDADADLPVQGFILEPRRGEPRRGTNLEAMIAGELGRRSALALPRALETLAEESCQETGG